MLTRPEHGWATVCLGGRKLDVSCIQPVPEMLLTALIRALTTDGTAELTFDAEGWEWRLAIGPQTCVTIPGESPETWTVDLSAQVFAREVLMDIRRDMDAWCVWQNAAGGMDDGWLLRLCNRLETLLN